MKEFDVIGQYFATGGHQRKDVEIGIGDDAAVTRVPAHQLLVTTTDTLVEGVHFLPDTPAQFIAHKAIAVNLSDLSAMGAEPAWISLSLSLPKVDEAWLAAFSSKIHELSEYYSFQLIGGDTVQGPLSITVTAQGFIPENNALSRGGAKSGDAIYVTGTLGDAGAGLDILKGLLTPSNPAHAEYLCERHHCPTPRVLAGTTLRRIASACIDISDGLLQDIQHIARASQTGVLLHLDKLPLSQALGESVGDLHQALSYAAQSGDDYELLFTASPEQCVNIETALQSYNIQVTCIGQMTGATGKLDLKLDEHKYRFEEHGQAFPTKGFEHFS